MSGISIWVLITSLFITGVIFYCMILGSARFKYTSDGSFITIRLTELDSSEQIQESFQRIVNQRAENDGFRTFQTTNGISVFLFVQCYNCPRGIAMFSIYCYQRVEVGHWLLRGYVPINDYDYTSTPGKDFTAQTLNIFNEGEYTKVAYRNANVFSISTNWIKQR